MVVQPQETAVILSIILFGGMSFALVVVEHRVTTRQLKYRMDSIPM